MEGGFFYQAFVFLVAAIVAVPVAKRLGLGSVLGYLIAGIIIGPFVFGFVGDEGHDIMHFAEFGVVMMLFLIGLELQPSLLWKLRAPILGLGGLQVVISAAIITIIVLLVTSLSWQIALAIGLSLALSSTAIVLQTLNEKGLMKSTGGQNAFSVLLFQDIAVIPILAFFPLLATYEISHVSGHETHTWIDGLSIALQTLIVLGAIVAIIVLGRYFISYAFRLIAQTRLRELFTAAALLLVISITLLMTKIGLSPALGAFLAGVVLAQNEYRHELETDIEPFKGLLLGLFFMTVGASIDFDLILGDPGLIAAIVGALIVVKFLVLIFIGYAFGMRSDNNRLFAFGLASGGEFAFVLLSYALQNGVATPDVVNPVIAAVAVSMALTPLLMLLNERLIQPYFGVKESEERKSDMIDEKNEVIIAGFGRYGSTIGRFLQAKGTQATYLDMDPNNVDLLRKLGLKVFYGDASRRDLLSAAGAKDAKLLIVAVDESEKSMEIVETAQKYFPQLKIMVRARTWDDYYDMVDHGIEDVYREFSDGALRIAADALAHIGYRRNQVYRSLLKFRARDEKYLRKLSESRHEQKAFIKHGRQIIEELELMMLEDIENEAKDKDLGWDTETIKEEFAPMIKKLKEENKGKED